MEATQPHTALKEFEGILSDPDVRKQLRKTLKGFALLYFSHHLYLPPGDHHEPMIAAMDDPLIEFLEVIGFRGCSKTTFGSLITPIYYALEKPDEYPFIIPISDTGLQSGINIANIKYELETNELLKQDYGTFTFGDIEDTVPEPSFETDEEWQARNLLLPNDVRILARSRGQKIRGLKHRQYRPRLVLIDDPEDIEWVKSRENRDKTEQWLNSEVIPGLDKQKRKLIILINNLHMDALAARVKAKGTFTVLEYPLVNDADEWASCIWKAQYPNQEAINAERKNAGAVAWQREYKLKVVSQEGAIITPEDIHYYDERPKGAVAAMKGHGIDLAISQKEGADYTAIVSGEVFYVEDKPKIFIRPNPYNEHVTFHDFLKRVRAIPGELGGANMFFVEDVQYQKAAIQEMERLMLSVIPMRPTTDKRSRLQVVAPYIKNGTVLFPRSGCEQLLGQIFNLGVESHDDLCLDGGTLIQTDEGEKPLRDISAGAFVMTRKGYKRVLWAGQTGDSEVITRFGLTGTANHPVLTKRGVIHLSEVKASDIVYMCHPSSLHIEEKCIGEIPKRNNVRIGSITGAMTNGRQRLTRFIATCGSPLTAQFREVCTSITEMATLSITSFQTSSLKATATTCATIWPIQSGRRNRARICSKPPSLPRELGTRRQREESGIASTPSGNGNIPKRIGSPAKSATVVLPVTTRRRVSGEETADTALGRIGIPNMSQPKINSSPSDAKRPVYNLLVEDAHEFFANGILVHNCDSLVWLLQGFADTGLELPKIHWIEG